MKMKPPMLWLQPSSLQGAPRPKWRGGWGGAEARWQGIWVLKDWSCFFTPAGGLLIRVIWHLIFVVRTHVPALCPAATVRAAWIRLSFPPRARLPSPGLRLRCARLS